MIHNSKWDMPATGGSWVCSVAGGVPGIGNRRADRGSSEGAHKRLAPCVVVVVIVDHHRGVAMVVAMVVAAVITAAVITAAVMTAAVMTAAVTSTAMTPMREGRDLHHAEREHSGSENYRRFLDHFVPSSPNLLLLPPHCSASFTQSRSLTSSDAPNPTETA